VIGKPGSYRKELNPREFGMSEAKYAAYEALGPFFEIIMKGLRGVVDGDHYFRYDRRRCDVRVPLRIPWMAPHNPVTGRVDDGVLRIASSPC
jgi:hypothetical protein